MDAISEFLFGLVGLIRQCNGREAMAIDNQADP
jgi:hypothetical protein